MEKSTLNTNARLMEKGNGKCKFCGNELENQAHLHVFWKCKTLKPILSKKAACCPIPVLFMRIKINLKKKKRKKRRHHLQKYLKLTDTVK
jgi:hypothetical protein